MISFGVQTWGTEWSALRAYWIAAERLGYDRVTYGDGLWAWTHAGWPALGALAALTRTARIGPAVTYCFDPAAHHPSWLAKSAVAVDHLSGGRLDLRLGVGANDPAAADCWRAHGLLYPEPSDRIEILDEGIQIIRALWSGTPVDFSGRTFTLKGAHLLPQPLQSSGPPIWVAAVGTRALALTAARADGWEASYLTPEAFARKWDQLKALLERHRRAPARLRRSVEVDVIVGDTGAAVRAWRERFCQERGIAPGDRVFETALVGEPAAIADRIIAYERAGATDFMLAFADFPATRMLERFAESIVRVLKDA